MLRFVAVPGRQIVGIYKLGIGYEDTQFHFWEYLFWTFGTVSLQCAPCAHASQLAFHNKLRALFFTRILTVEKGLRMSRPQHVESMFFLTVLLLHLVRTGGLDFPCRNAVFCAGAIRGRNGGGGGGGKSCKCPHKSCSVALFLVPDGGMKPTVWRQIPQSGVQGLRIAELGLWTTVGTLHESRDMDFYIFGEKGKSQDMEENWKVRHISNNY
jgi:hypothetical protein